jgi:hypothetical protein
MGARPLGKRLVGTGLLLALLVAAAGIHNHADLARIAAAGGGLAGTDRVLSSHSPLEKASHWHSVIRAHEHSCLACHLHRFAAIPERAHDPAPAHADQFVSHAAPQCIAQVFRLSDPTRGPPSHS